MDTGGRYSSLALDAQEHPHIGYRVGQSPNRFLRYAWFDGTTWHTEDVDTSDIEGHISLALDSIDRPHMSYYGNADLKYAHHDGINWNIQTLESSSGIYTSIVVDAADHPHISYYNWNADILKYAYYDGSSWHREVVDSEGDTGLSTSIALDSAGQPHISYCRTAAGYWTCDQLKYAHYDGDSWSIEIIEQGFVGQYSSLVLDPFDRPHISYCQGEYRRCAELKFTQHDGSAWQIQIVDRAGEVGGNSSLALDRAGWPHIAYSDMMHNQLKYAHFTGREWISETVTAGDYGISLGLDSETHPHISEPRPVKGTIVVPNLGAGKMTGAALIEHGCSPAK